MLKFIDKSRANSTQVSHVNPRGFFFSSSSSELVAACACVNAVVHPVSTLTAVVHDVVSVSHRSILARTLESRTEKARHGDERDGRIERRAIGCLLML